MATRLDNLIATATLWQHQRGRWPQAEELFASAPAFDRRDLWRTPFRIETTDQGITIVSAGIDRAFDTTDDLRRSSVAADQHPDRPRRRASGGGDNDSPVRRRAVATPADS